MASSPDKFLKYKEVSTRLIRPTSPEIRVPLLMEYLNNWQNEYEMGDVVVYDEQLAQYMLCDDESHHKFYCALILGKPSLRCALSPEEPRDVIGEETGNKLALVGGSATQQEVQAVETLTNILSKKGYKFVA